MGKYMRKAKVSGEVAVMEVAAAPLGVRTRARSLALQRLQRQQPQPQGEEKGSAGGEYLELRNRRLEKLPPPAPAVRGCGGRKAAAVAAAQEETEASSGENVVESEAMERSTRETTPCSLIRGSETISTPGSTTRPSHLTSQRRVQAPVRIIPCSAEMDEFFAVEERKQQQDFIDKYNFDPVNDSPLPGRYEWVKLD